MSFRKIIIFVAVILLISAAVASYLIFQRKPVQPSGVQTQEEERKVLNFPTGKNEAENQAYLNLVDKLAKEVKDLNISGCLAKPVVVKVKRGGIVTVKNDDATERRMTLDKDILYTIPASGKKEIIVDASRPAGIWGYGCDLVQNSAGIFLVND